MIDVAFFFIFLVAIFRANFIDEGEKNNII